MTDLGTVGTDPCSRALAINSKGQVVGGSSDCNTFLHAYIWEDGGDMIDLNTFVPPGSDLTLTLATFINEHGVIAGNGVLSNGDTHAFMEAASKSMQPPRTTPLCRSDAERGTIMVVASRNHRSSTRSPRFQNVGFSRTVLPY